MMSLVLNQLHLLYIAKIPLSTIHTINFISIKDIIPLLAVHSYTVTKENNWYIELLNQNLFASMAVIRQNDLVPFSSLVTVILVWMATVQSFPTGRMESTNFNNSSYVAAADSPVIMSDKIREILTSTFTNSSGLYSLWEGASNLSQGNLLKAKVSEHMYIYK